MTESSSCLRRPSIRRHLTRGISRGIRRAFEKMAVSTRTRRSGPPSPSQRSARYEINVENPGGVSRGVSRADIDGLILPQRPIRVPLVDDGATHKLSIILG